MSSSASSPAPRPRLATSRLSGVSTPLDRRVHAVRGDLADIALAGRVIAPRYAAPVPMRAAAGGTMIHSGPADDSVCTSELLPGEGFAVFDRTGPWAWGQCATDQYVGWVKFADLEASDARPRQRIRVAHALLFSGPSIKAPVAALLPSGSLVEVEPYDDDFRRCGEAFIHRRHLDAPAGDAVDFAHNFIGTPYRWGGRTRAGLDCSGLVQTVLGAHGVACPRDSDQQLAAFPAVAFAARRRGDLVAFPGHIGILVDAEHLLHANAFHMTTVTEPLAEVVARLQPLHDKPVLGVVRPPCEGSGRSL